MCWSGETDNTQDVPGSRAPLVLNMDKFNQVTQQVCQVAEARRTPMAWYITFALGLGLLSLLGFCILYLHRHRCGCLGPEQPGDVGV